MTIISSSRETLFAFSATNEKALVLQGVTVAANGSAIVSDENNNSLFNAGYIYGADGETVRFDRTTSDGDTNIYGKVFNAPGATIASSATAISSGQDKTLVSNDGSIQAGGIGVDLTCSDARIGNSGTINSTGDGVDFSGSNFSLNNSGTINAATDGVELTLSSNSSTSIYNSGLISGGDFAINCGGDGSGMFNLRNSGVLDGNVFSGNQSTIISNMGTIDGLMEFGSGEDVFRNYGTLNGDLDLFSISGGNTETVYNRGTIKGDVNLGQGGGVFDGRKGSVTGTITGGVGADTIVAGDDGEIMAGGKGHDILTGGSGADTFAFSSTSSADTDIVHRFNVNQDTIQLARSTFTRLVVGQTPSFSIGTAATSATDYLIYNASTGVLSYDVDGSGSRAPYTIATFDKGLNLAASNFSVV